MTPRFTSAMRRATDLVRSGDLSAATDMIRNTLGGGETAAAGAKTPAPAQASPRKGLGQTLSDLAARMPHGTMPTPAQEAPLPKGARFDAGNYACAQGSRDYRVYVPALTGAPRGMIVMLHGCTQSPVDFANGTKMNRLADQHGLIVVYPEQPRSANMNACWNWFQASDQERDGGEPAILAGLTRELRERHAVPQDKVFVAGLSAGAAMAVILGRSYPDLYSGVGAHSGLPYKAADTMAGAFAAMGGKPSSAPAASGTPVPTIVFHGSADTTVAPVNGDRIAEETRPEGAEVIDGGNAGGRSFTRTSVLSDSGHAAMEYWNVAGLGHAWSGGHPSGSHTDAQGPDASAEMVRFFLNLPRQGE
ncbi:PHB depolymerase family esterase [Marinovum sp.]|uniref:extracellular catalytic domain type 1 short-chain-length polyhydroxyalkanoate depolymerase n=1 Tax=Marinovum sp. TaxID=2024839 RepID=UPI002B26E79D|nr:PHB depolymerase family esterase [Marinovum sp.]